MLVLDLDAFLPEYPTESDVDKLVEELKDKDTHLKSLSYYPKTFSNEVFHQRFQLALEKNSSLESVELILVKDFHFPKNPFFKLLRGKDKFKKLTINFNEKNLSKDECYHIFHEVTYLVGPEQNNIHIKLANKYFSDNDVNYFLDGLVTLTKQKGMKKLTLYNIRISNTADPERKNKIIENLRQRVSDLQLKFDCIHFFENSFYDNIYKKVPNFSHPIMFGHVFSILQVLENNIINPYVLKEAQEAVYKMLTDQFFKLFYLNYFVYKDQDETEIVELLGLINKKPSLTECDFNNIITYSFFQYIQKYLNLSKLNRIGFRLELARYDKSSSALIDFLFFLLPIFNDTNKKVWLWLSRLDLITNDQKKWQAFCMECKYNLQLQVDVITANEKHFLDSVNENFNISISAREEIIHNYFKFFDYYEAFCQIKKSFVNLKNDAQKMKQVDVISAFETLTKRFDKVLNNMLMLHAISADSNNKIFQVPNFINLLGVDINDSLKKYKESLNNNNNVVMSEKTANTHVAKSENQKSEDNNKNSIAIMTCESTITFDFNFDGSDASTIGSNFGESHANVSNVVSRTPNQTDDGIFKL